MTQSNSLTITTQTAKEWAESLTTTRGLVVVLAQAAKSNRTLEGYSETLNLIHERLEDVVEEIQNTILELSNRKLLIERLLTEENASNLTEEELLQETQSMLDLVEQINRAGCEHPLFMIKNNEGSFYWIERYQQEGWYWFGYLLPNSEPQRKPFPKSLLERIKQLIASGLNYEQILELIDNTEN